MKADCEVISAFIDDEPFDSETLLNALATVEGREFLIDSIALRRLTRSGDDAPVVRTSKSSVGRILAVAAALILAALASFQLGQRQALNASGRAPAPTRVVSGGPAWQEDAVRGGVR